MDLKIANQWPAEISEQLAIVLLVVLVISLILVIFLVLIVSLILIVILVLIFVLVILFVVHGFHLLTQYSLRRFWKTIRDNLL